MTEPLAPEPCEHRVIQTWTFDDGDRAGAVAGWACLDCRRKFAPREVGSQLTVERLAEGVHGSRSITHKLAWVGQGGLCPECSDEALAILAFIQEPTEGRA